MPIPEDCRQIVPADGHDCTCIPRLDPARYGATLHADASYGRVAIGRKLKGAPHPWHQEMVPISQLPDALPALAGEHDVYLSVNRFGGWRRIAHLISAGALFVDVDYHKLPALRDAHPTAVLEMALVTLEANRLPEPSLAISSGRGLYLIWLHGPIPRRALPRWNVCQRVLWEALKLMGADHQALDAARVLRIVGTRNGKNGAVVQIIGGTNRRWSFDDLADRILPLSRSEAADLRAVRAAKGRAERLGGVPEGYGKATLWATRLDDLQRLRDLRWFGGQMDDYRDRWIFLSGVGISWITPPDKLRRELHTLAHDVGGWSEGKARSKMHAVFRTAEAAARGETVTWQGAEVDPRYRFRSETIMEMLEITPDEERQMATLISSDERRRRNTAKKTQARRQAGVMSRDEYLTMAAQNRSEIARLKAEGHTTKQIAEALKLSQSHVKNTLRQIRQQGGTKCVPVYGGEASASGKDARKGAAGNAGIIRNEAEVFEFAKDFFGLPRSDTGSHVTEEAEAEQLSFVS